MKRRAVLFSTVSMVALAGCASDTDRAENIVDEISSDVDVETWSLQEGTLSLEYYTTGSITADLEIIGDAYADAVGGGYIRSGIDADLEATALGASNEFTFDIDRSLAEKYDSGALSQDEYIDRIAESG